MCACGIMGKAGTEGVLNPVGNSEEKYSSIYKSYVHYIPISLVLTHLSVYLLLAYPFLPLCSCLHTSLPSLLLSTPLYSGQEDSSVSALSATVEAPGEISCFSV